MSRVTFWFKDSTNYVSVEADLFYEVDGFFKAYNENEVVAMFAKDIVEGVYKTEGKSK